jgi:hypothetical protein
MPTPSFSHLLRFDPDIPFQAQAALHAAESAANPRLAQAWRRRAAFVLGSAFDLNECEQAELVDLDGRCPELAAA